MISAVETAAVARVCQLEEDTARDGPALKHNSRECWDHKTQISTWHGSVYSVFLTQLPLKTVAEKVIYFYKGFLLGLLI